MKLQYCLTILLCLFLKSDAQQIRPLSVGDKVPDLVIKNIYNYPALQSKLAAFSNGLLILDFMATNCSSCIKVLPAFDALQKKYGDKITMLLVTNQTSEKVKSFFSLHPELRLPVVTSDVILEKLFPHVFISHEVWIHNGIVKAITHTEYVNEKNIDDVLANEKINWPVKRDLATFDYSQFLLRENENIPTTSLPENFYYATFSKYMEDVPPKYIRSVDSTKKIVRTLIINKPVINLYLYCFGKPGLPVSHIILKAKNPSGFFYNKSDGWNTWNSEHTYCYETIFPFDVPAKQSCDKMIADLDFYFGMRGTIDTVLTACYELHRSDTSIHLLSRDDSRALGRQDGSMSLSVKELILMQNNALYGTPTFNETGMFEKEYLNIPRNSTDLTILTNAIAKFGLQLIPVKRKVEMFILQESSLKN